MTLTPLTHHDIARHAAPLVRAGLRVDLAASERAARRILFQPLPSAGLVLRHALELLPGGGVELTRAVADPAPPLVSTLVARAAAAEDLVDVFSRIPPTRQIVREIDGVVIAQSWALEPHGGPAEAAARLELRQLVGFAGALCLVVDTSTGAAMPAEVRLVDRARWQDVLRATLANGASLPQRHPAARALLERERGAERRVGAAPAARGGTDASATLCAALPDDVLAVLGPEWRPLVWQGDRWKGSLGGLGREPERSERAERLGRAALAHLARVGSEPPERYHARHAAARRRVFVRRLRPAMALAAILGVAPLAWLLVARGGIAMHPLALGLTPLLMVGVILLSAREIPVLELPPWPRALAPGRWRATPPATSPDDPPRDPCTTAR